MATAFFIFIVLVFFHLYFQNIIRNLFLLLEQSKLFDLEMKLEEFKSRNTISFGLYLGLKTLFKCSHQLLSNEQGVETYIALNPTTLPSRTKDTLQHLFEKNKNFDVADLYIEWAKIMKSAVYINYYAWAVYLFPFIAYKNLKKIVSRKQSQYFDHWLSTIVVPDHFSGM